MALVHFKVGNESIQYVVDLNDSKIVSEQIIEVEKVANGAKMKMTRDGKVVNEVEVDESGIITENNQKYTYNEYKNETPNPNGGFQTASYSACMKLVQELFATGAVIGCGIACLALGGPVAAIVCGAICLAIERGLGYAGAKQVCHEFFG